MTTSTASSPVSPSSTLVRSVTVPEISVPGSITAHLGPTNSGKTFSSLQELTRRGVGLYISPLRMLSQEVYRHLVGKLGPHQVGLLNGDQIINPEASILCCTAEMAPACAPFAVIDEAHWLRDAERGPAWTRLFTQCRYDQVSVIAAAETEQLLRSIQPAIEIVTHRRLGEIVFRGSAKIDDLVPGDVVVAFSRAAVLSLARRISEEGFKVGALYGSLPPAARFDQIQRFERGDLEVIVATDAIGHGVNLPADAVIFAETAKFDGVERRPLARWEVAQIAGRAGRGVGAEGEVRVLAGVHGFEPDAGLVAAGVEVAAGRATSGLVVERLLVEPALDDLDCDDPRLLARALKQWARAAATELDDHPWASPASVRPMRNHLKVLAGAWGGRPWPVDVRTAFGIAAAPVSRDEDLLVVARATLGERVDLHAEWGCGGLAEMNLVQLERIAGSCRSLASSARRLGGIGGLDAAELGAVGDRAERRAVELLDLEIRRNSFGRCRSCGRDLQPRFDVCRRCRPASGRPGGGRGRTRTVTSHVVRRDAQGGGSPAGHRGVEVSR